MKDAPLVRNKGNYKSLICYQKAELIYDITYHFAHTFLQRNDRTIDQMVQAARSGKQNIVEGYGNSAISAELSIRLYNVAKSSLMELLSDYEDYLRTRKHRIWEEYSDEYKAMRQLGSNSENNAKILEISQSRPAEVVANMAIILIRQTDYLLYNFIQAASERFSDEGGFSEKMYHHRIAIRQKH